MKCCPFCASNVLNSSYSKRTQARVLTVAFLVCAISTASVFAVILGAAGFFGGLSVFSAVFLWKAVAAMRGDKE